MEGIFNALGTFDEKETEENYREDELQYALNLIQIAIDSKVKLLRKDLKKMKISLADRETEYRKLCSQCEEAEKTLSKFSEENEELEGKNRKLENEIEDAKEENVELKKMKTQITITMNRNSKIDGPERSDSSAILPLHKAMMGHKRHFSMTERGLPESESKSKSIELYKEIKKRLSDKEFSNFMLLMKQLQRESNKTEILKQLRILLGEEKQGLIYRTLSHFMNNL